MGSLTSDAGRKIAKIDYDYRNNPVRIQFTNGNVTKYVYSAGGEKLRVIYQTAVPNITVAIGNSRELSRSEIQYTDSTDYLLGGSLTLKNGRIDKYQFDEGYCQAEKNANNTSQDDFTFCYYDRDHLGNIRQVTKASGSKGTVIQTMNYYPFGAQFCDGSAGNSDVQSHKYNGKEFDKMHGLNTYDYGARQYNSVTARWDRMDRMAEKYYPYSPYTYCLNSPICLIDPDGREPGDFFRCIDDAAKDFGNCYNGKSISQNIEYGTMIFQVVNSNYEIGYTYNIPSVGNENSVAIENAPIGSKVVAMAHTHGKYMEAKNPDCPNYNNEFSGMRMKIGGKILPKENRKVVNANNDIGNANILKLDNYVATPNGSLQKYNHKTGEITVISNDMPSDPNDPNRLNNRTSSNDESNTDILKILRTIMYQQY